MPIPYLGYVLREGIHVVPFLPQILKTAAWIAVIALLKLYFVGPKNKSERVMHSKVIMITVRFARSAAHSIAV